MQSGPQTVRATLTENQWLATHPMVAASNTENPWSANIIDKTVPWWSNIFLAHSNPSKKTFKEAVRTFNALLNLRCKTSHDDAHTTVRLPY